ncbi:hypothetical protein CPB84DRAFT_1727048 [Gymnopilus junonius]|uniref:Uncharacterized protein n=1 Tax=Gymnopilus junonius TaxID=109634 RepID=A0A9P5NSV6_GYMJU|nr:hypothetical protein CPB84DRAFT_1727048 [Gymnopilus junonius]
MFTLFRLFAVVLFFCYRAPLALAFSYTFGTLSECDNVPLTWTGGTPPFQLLIVPVFGTPVNISIPSSAFSNGVGSYSFQLPIANGSQMVFVMSDATGFNSGGTTEILTTQPSKGVSCNTNTTVNFSFQLNSALQQCRPYVFNGYTAAVQPVTINAVVPGGSALTLRPPTGPTSFTWNADVARGTSLIFFMIDAQGRQGGSSDVKMVGSSDDSTCLNANSPTSTAGPPASSATSLSTTPSASASSTSAPAHSGVSIAAVAGTVIGSLLFLAVVITLGLFFLRRRHDSRNQGNYRRQSRRLGPGIDPAYDPPANAPPPTYGSDPLASSSAHQYSGSYQPSESSYQSTEGYQLTPQIYPPRQAFPPPDPFSSSAPPMMPESEIEPFAEQSRGETSSSRDSMTPAQRKAALAANNARYNPPTRFILHTDVEDAIPPNEDGVVELPPQYSERRGPLDINPSPSQPDAGHPLGASYPS